MNSPASARASTHARHLRAIAAIANTGPRTRPDIKRCYLYMSVCESETLSQCYHMAAWHSQATRRGVAPMLQRLSRMLRYEHMCANSMPVITGRCTTALHGVWRCEGRWAAGRHPDGWLLGHQRGTHAGSLISTSSLERLHSIVCSRLMLPIRAACSFGHLGRCIWFANFVEPRRRPGAAQQSTRPSICTCDNHVALSHHNAHQSSDASDI